MNLIPAEMGNIIRKVFTTQGVPDITYVSQENGKNEIKLREIISSGEGCVIIGNSKTGKTSLYMKIITELYCEANIIKITGNNKTNITEIYSNAIESIGIPQQKSKILQKNKTKGHSIDAELAGKVPLVIDAKAKAQKSEKTSQGTGDTFEYVQGPPSANKLIKLIKGQNKIIVIEDFHYLNDEVKECISEDAKNILQNKIPLLIVCTAPHESDIVLSNRDLSGRIVKIEFKPWEKNDLIKIINQGFNHLKISISDELKEIIAQESVGLPIITQAICKSILLNKIKNGKRININRLKFTRRDIENSLWDITQNEYYSLKTIYDNIVNNVEEKFYDILRVILASFTINPLVFKMNIKELKKRCNTICEDNQITPWMEKDIENCIKSINKSNNLVDTNIIEWISLTQELNIIDTTFLFYLRWYNKENIPTKNDLYAYDILDRLLRIKEEF